MNIKKTLFLSLLCSAMVTIVVCLIGYYNTNSLIDAGKEVKMAQDMVAEVEHVQSLLQNSQLSEREFLVTGIEDTLGQYISNKTEIFTQLDMLKSELGVGNDLGGKISKIIPLVNMWYDEATAKEIVLRHLVDKAATEQGEGEEVNLKIEDLINTEMLREYQRLFTLTTGLANLVVEADGTPVENQSFEEFTEFCFGYVRKTDVGGERCAVNDVEGGKKALETGKPAVYTCHAGLVDFGVPLLLDGKLIGSWLGGQVLTSPPDLDKFRAYAKEIGADPDGMVEAVKKVPVVPRERIDAAGEFLSLFANIVSEMGSDLYRRKKVVEYVNSGESAKLYSTINLGLNELRAELLAKAGARSEESVAASERVEFIFIAMIPISLVLTIILALVVGSGIVKPIKLVKESYAVIAHEFSNITSILHNDLAKGNWNVGVPPLEKPFEVTKIEKYAMKKNEIGQMCATALNMITSYENNCSAIEDVIEQISSVLKEVKSFAVNIDNSASEIGKMSESISQATSSQMASVSDINVNIKELTNNSINNSESIINANKNIANADRAAQKAHENIEIFNRFITAINEKSVRTQKVVKTIDDIAFQTNLLALNAAVEAARAGNHGKGFAVVAEEVRNLASNSARAANETASLIQDVVTEIQKGNELAANTSEGISSISSHMDESTKLMRGVSDSSLNNTHSVEQISRDLNQIDGITQGNAASAEEAAASSKNLEHQTRDLHKLIDYFTLE